MAEESNPSPSQSTGKKITLGSIGTLIVALFSTPGFISWLEGGSEKAEVAYEVLQAEVDALKVADQRRFEEEQRHRQLLLMLFMQSGGMGMPGMYGDPWGMGGGGGGGTGMGFGGGSGELMSPEALFPAAADGDGDADDEGCEEAVGGVSEPPPPMPEVPSVPQLLEQLTAPTAPPSIEQHPPLPDKLSDIMKKK